MTSVLAERPGVGAPDLVGAQRPRIASVPAYRFSSGPEAVELAARMGQRLDDWQGYVLTEGLGERDDGTWASPEVCLIVSRQSGKGTVVEALIAAGLALFDERLIVYSAHEFRTAQEMFRRTRRFVEESADLAARVVRIVQSTNEMGIELEGDRRVRFLARSKGAGRGFSGDRIILDEAYSLDARHMDAILPTTLARPNPQIWYLSSAGMETSTQLSRLRRRGLARDPLLAFFEWSARAKVLGDDADDDFGDPATWAKANPGLGIRISVERMAVMHRSLGTGFARECLGVGEYPPVDDELRWEVIAEQAWTALADPDGERPARVAFAFAVSPDRDRAVIAVAGFRADGSTLHVEIPAGDDGAEDYRDGTAWVIPRLARLKERWKPVAVVADPRGAEGALLDEAAEAGVEVTTITAGDLTAACGQWYDRVARGTLRHAGQRDLDRAVGGARKRTLTGGAWAWEVAGLEVEGSPLRAATLAAWGAAHARATVPLFARG